MKINPDADFGTRDCPSCATQVSRNHNRCPVCQYEFPNGPQGSDRFSGYMLLILGFFALLVIIGFLLRFIA